MRWCNIQSLRKAQSKLNLRFSATQFEAELEYHFHPGPPSAAPNCSRTFAPPLISRDLLLPSPRLSPPLVFLRGGSPPLRSPRRSLHSVHLSIGLLSSVHCTISLTPSHPPAANHRLVNLQSNSRSVTQTVL